MTKAQLIFICYAKSIVTLIIKPKTYYEQLIFFLDSCYSYLYFVADDEEEAQSWKRYKHWWRSWSFKECGSSKVQCTTQVHEQKVWNDSWFVFPCQPHGIRQPSHPFMVLGRQAAFLNTKCKIICGLNQFIHPNICIDWMYDSPFPYWFWSETLMK